MKKTAQGSRTCPTSQTCPTFLVLLLALLPLHPAFGAVVTNAYDDASHAAYGGGFTNNSNGGTGFGPWDLTNGFGTTIGGFIGDSTQNGRTTINTGGNAFGLYANPPEASIDARRTFNGGQMSVGETFSFDMNASWNGGLRGFLMYNGDFANPQLFELQHGGSDALRLNGGQIFANVFNQSLAVSVTALTGTNLLLSINASSSGLYQTNLVVSALPDRFKFYYYNNTDGNNGSNYEPYFNRFTKTAGLTRYVALNNATPVAPYLTWATAATNIQDAVNVAFTNDTVLVSNGVYQTGTRAGDGSNRVFIGKAVAVQSVNGPGVTTIRGNSSLGVIAVRCVWMTNGASLTGFTLNNGGTPIAGGSGGGVRGGVVSNCTLSGNAANDGGGGAYQAALYNCTLSGNSANLGGGARSSTLNNCTLVENSAQGGGGAYEATLNNCTLAGNSAGDGGGASDCGLNNCIVYFNTDTFSPNGDNPNHVGGTLTYTCTTPDPGGTGNFTNDPLFVSLATTNLRIAAGSPCRDTGDNADAPGATDLDGNARIVNGYVDLGAYEYQGAGQGDYDGDGIGNGDEGIAGTGFTDSNDVFAVSGVIVMSPATISFDSELGRVYAVDRNDALVPSPQVWTEFTNNVAGTGGALVINDLLPGTNRNYRVRVKLQ